MSIASLVGLVRIAPVVGPVRLAWVVAVALLGIGCSSYAPLPYTAEQIRAACPAGRTITFRREPSGGPAALRVIRFVSVDADGAEIETFDHSEGGAPIETPTRQRVAWEELRRHAAFPAAATTVEDGVIATPAGTFAAMVYTVTSGADVARYYFAKDRPGPPVLFYVEQGGRRLLTTTMAR